MSNLQGYYKAGENKEILEIEMIFIKGKPKTQQIVSINEDNKGVYWVRFTNGKVRKLAMTQSKPIRYTNIKDAKRI